MKKHRTVMAVFLGFGISAFGVLVLAFCGEIIAAESYTITGAADYRMFVDMLSTTRWIVGGFCGTLFCLLSAFWYDMRTGCASKRIVCQQTILGEHNDIWGVLSKNFPDDVALARDKQIREKFRGQR